MDERAQEEIDWEEWFGRHHDELLRNEGSLDALKHSAEQKDQAALTSQDQPWVSPGTISSVKGLVRELIRVWEELRTIRRRLILTEKELKQLKQLTDERLASFATNAKITDFLKKFQEWMDRYGPMLENEYQQWVKVQGK